RRPAPSDVRLRGDVGELAQRPGGRARGRREGRRPQSDRRATRGPTHRRHRLSFADASESADARTRIVVPNLIELDDVSFAYESGRVLSDVTLSIKPKDYAVLLGANGSGKTTLLKVALGLLKPTRGRALLFGKRASDPRARE